MAQRLLTVGIAASTSCASGDVEPVTPPWRSRWSSIVALVVLATMVLAISACAAASPVRVTERVLFVGNSLTYVGNVPALYAALAAADGRRTTSDMIVRGGATLTQRVADRSVEGALATGKYTALVIQERGGDLMCSFGPESCIESREAIRSLARLARHHGVDVVLLGTYQSAPVASRRLVEAESAAAREAGIRYIEVSSKLQRLRGAAPQLSWFAADGMHPGEDLALLKAMLVHDALHGSLPEPAALTVEAPIYGIRSGLTASLRRADAPPPLPDTPREVSYSAETIRLLLAAIDGGVIDGSRSERGR